MVILVPLSVFAIHTYPSYSEAKTSSLLNALIKWLDNSVYVGGQTGGRAVVRELEKNKTNKKKSEKKRD